MRRSAAVVAGLFLLSAWLARPVVGQSTAPGCARVIASRARVAPDSTRVLWSLTCQNGKDTVRITRTDTLRIVRVDTVYVTKDSTVTPPPPPPADSGKDSTVTPPPAGVLWSADWASGEITSGGKFAIDNNNAPILSVVPALPGFPATMKNVLRVRVGWTGCSACDGQYAAAAWLTARGIAPMPTKVGESRAYRVYVTNDVGAYHLGWSGFHPLEGNGQDGGTDDQVWSWKYEANANGTIGFVFHTPNAAIRVTTSP